MRYLGWSLLLLVLTGCSSSSSHEQHQSERLQCKLNPSSCMYEGSYEPGEDKYAEQRAKELNQESLRKLKRQRSWW